jgi:YD repeat-containing protein
VNRRGRGEDVKSLIDILKGTGDQLGPSSLIARMCVSDCHFDEGPSGRGQADGGVWDFAYTAAGSQVTQTVVTDPRGKTTTYAFNPAGYLTSITWEWGTRYHSARGWVIQRRGRGSWHARLHTPCEGFGGSGVRGIVRRGVRASG